MRAESSHWQHGFDLNRIYCTPVHPSFRNRFACTQHRPWLYRNGYAVVRRRQGRFELLDAGVIRTKTSSSIPERLAIIRTGLVGTIERSQPQSVGMKYF